MFVGYYPADVPNDKIEAGPLPGTMQVWVQVTTEVAGKSISRWVDIYVRPENLAFVPPQPAEVTETLEAKMEREAAQKEAEEEEFDDVVRKDDEAYILASESARDLHEKIENLVVAVEAVWDRKNEVWNEQHAAHKALKDRVTFRKAQSLMATRAECQLKWLLLLKVEQELLSQLREVDSTFDVDDAFAVRYPEQVKTFHKTYGDETTFVYHNDLEVVFKKALKEFFKNNAVPKWWDDEVRKVAFGFISENKLPVGCGGGVKGHKMSEWVSVGQY